MMEKCLHHWSFVGGNGGSSMEVYGQGPPKRCGGHGGAC